MDKNKIIEAAAKLVAKGAYDKAIKEYQKVLDTDPKDVRILQKLGELYQKKNDNTQAAVCFTKVAENYASDGFFLKAVALYKQVLKLDPNLIEVNLKLAELHQQLQLMSEAMTYYQVVANHYDKAGDARSSLATLKKMVDLDPDNVASRRKLAELYMRENMQPEAIAEFRKAAEHYKRTNRSEEYVAVAEKISTLEPQNYALNRELADFHLARGDQKRALAKLQVCFKADPRDIDTLKLLAVAFQGLGQTAKTLSVFKELARVYSDQGRKADADGVWQKIEQLDPHDPDFVARKSQAASPQRHAPVPSAPAAPARPPAPSSSPTSIISTAAAAPLGKDNLAKLLTETDVYLKYGLHDKALEHLRKIFNVDPENIDAHEKAYAIYVASNNRVQAGEQLLNVLRLHTRGSDQARAQPFLDAILEQNPNHPEVAVFLATLRPGGTAENDIPDDAILVDSSGDEVLVPDESTVLQHQTEYDVALHVSDHQEGEELVEDEAMELSSYAADEEPVVEEPVVEEPVEEEVLEHDEAFVEPIIEEPEEEGLALGDSYDRTSEMPAYTEDAAAAESEVTSDGYVGEPEYAEPEEVVEEEVVESPEEEIPAQEECDEALFFMEQRLFDEAQEILETVLIAFPGHARATELMGQLEAQRDGTAAPAQEESYAEGSEPVPDEGYDGGSRDAFDLAAELASELGDEVLSPDVPSGEVPSADYQVSVDEVFSEFKKGLEKVVKPEDVDTHYDLGIAYKEMGLIDDAIGEFEVARKGANGNRKEVDCLSMAATLYVMKGDFAAAVDALKSALQSPHAAGDIEKAIRYELGVVYEQANELGKALHQFMKVNEVDPSYRDVASMVERLAAVASPEEDEVQPPPRSSPARPRASAGAGARGR